ncbi:MAG: hypothetical protein ACRCXZ_09870 [Patescibacteria group bacterium]
MNLDIKLLLIIIASFVFVLIGAINLWWVLRRDILKKDKLEDRPHL